MKPEEAIEKVKDMMNFIIGEHSPNDAFISHMNDAIKALERQHGECKTCKHYVPYRDQFSYRPRGDGYCKSAITTSEGEAYINCHDEWYCANYEREGGEK